MPGQRGSQKSAAGDAKSEDAYNKMASRPGSQRAPAGPSSVPTTNSASIKKASPCVQASSSSASKNGTSGPSRTNTGGSNATTSSASSSGLTRFPATQHAQPVVIEIDDDDDDAPEIIEPIQATTQPDFIFYGTFQDIVVGIDYYNGVTTRGEQVLVVREPNNKYDTNAIRVLNVQGIQVGHIRSKISKYLAPFMDEGIISLEGTVEGVSTKWEVPIEVEVYGTPRRNQRHRIIATLLPRGFSLKGGIAEAETPEILAQQAQDTREQAELYRKRKADALQQARAAAWAKKAKSILSVPVGTEVIDVESLPPSSQRLERLAHNDSLALWNLPPAPRMMWDTPQMNQPQIPTFQSLVQDSESVNPREANLLMEKYGLDEKELEKMPMAEQPSHLCTSLLPYQLQGLHWLIDKENPKLPTSNNDVIQFWKVHPSRPAGWYLNAVTFFSLDKPPELASGGILADDMGLGKTLQMISLIVADLEKNGKQAGMGGTLIVAPVSVMSNWSQQMECHVQRKHALKVGTFHGNSRAKSAQELSKYDIVITSYGTLSSEYEGRKSCLLELKWRRIILDEAHQIRNPKTKSSIAAASVNAQSRWALTGTPIVNSLKDLYSLVRFLKFSEQGGLCDPDIFNRRFIRPLNAGKPDGHTRLQALMGAVCLRRQKEMEFVNLKLPELSEYVYKVKLSDEEHKKYDLLESDAQGILDKFAQDKDANAAGGSLIPKDKGNEYRYLLEILLRLRQLCNHWSLCGEQRLKVLEERMEELKKAGMNEEVREILQELLQVAIDSREDCSICMEPLHNPTITPCKHVFGLECIRQAIEMKHECPLCRNRLEDTSFATLVEPKPVDLTKQEQTPTQNMDSDSSDELIEPSSKITALLAILEATRANGSTNKTVVFSQWTKFLDLLQPHLHARGFRFCRIDGSMHVKARDEALEKLAAPNCNTEEGAGGPGCEILLASLAVASVGLNLVAANQVILTDCWWAPAIEDQAVDRVHRLGQKRKTTVFRLVGEKTVEEKVLLVQEKKRNLVATAFMEKKGKGNQRGKGKETRLADIQMLLRRG